MANARINFSQVRIEVEKQIGSVKAYRQAAISAANEVFDEAKENFLHSFDEHEVTKEIERGPDTEESVLDYGNLFSFLGFNEGDEPIQDLREFFETHINIVQCPITEQSRYLFRINGPTRDEIADATPMEWGTAKSWVYAIENGIPGFNKYLFDLDRAFANSRSGPAVQVDDQHKLREGSFERIPYVTPLLQEFKKELKS